MVHGTASLLWMFLDEFSGSGPAAGGDDERLCCADLIIVF